MKRELFVFIAMGMASISGIVQAAENNTCAPLRQQLSAMQRAQQALLGTMVTKNDSLAALFDHYAQDFESEERRLKKSDIENLRSSAQAFRSHREREQKLVEKFERSSLELVGKINECLAKADSSKVANSTMNQ